MLRNRRCGSIGLFSATGIAVGAGMVLLLAVGGSAAAQNREKAHGAKRIEALLRQSGITRDGREDAAAGGRSFEACVVWRAYESTQPVEPGSFAPAYDAFSVKRVSYVPESPVVPRAPELSPNTVIVAAVDSLERLRAWTLQADPRTLRMESAGERGQLSGKTLHLPTANFSVSLPADAAIIELRFYQPHWSGSDYTLELLGSAPFEAPAR